MFSPNSEKHAVGACPARVRIEALNVACPLLICSRFTIYRRGMKACLFDLISSNRLPAIRYEWIFDHLSRPESPQAFLDA
jgi:hypothetical protein